MRCSERRKTGLKAELSFRPGRSLQRELPPFIFSIKTLAYEALEYGTKDVQLDYIQI